MKVRGRRRCADCGHRWSYFETGEVTCPACGSIRSVGVDEERTLHTDSDASLDLTEAYSRVDDRPLPEVAEVAGSAARAYKRSRGFVDAGDLQRLDDTFVAATELAHAAEELRRTMRPSEAAEAYFLELLSGAPDGERPETIPEEHRAIRGRAAADAVEVYRRDLATWLDEHPDPAARDALDRLRTLERRLAALDGDVPTGEADALVEAAREVGDYLREDDETALARAKDRLERLG